MVVSKQFPQRRSKDPILQWGWINPRSGARNFDSIERDRSQDETYQGIVMEGRSAVAVLSWGMCQKETESQVFDLSIIHHQRLYEINCPNA